ncbi:MAG: transcriptional regulator [Gammaproteobacteria bacterium]|nr:MAG: transcriptional regulator [Gammaproteobacteria bacterium]
MKKITINDVARHAGVSKKTISRVLNQEPNVSSETRKKVEKSFTELGYRPNPQARALASSQSYLIGLLYPSQSNSYVSNIQKGALERCRAEGFHLVIYPEDHENESLISQFESNLNSSNLDGIILTPPFADMRKLLDLLKEREIPVVRVGAISALDSIPSVISNDAEASYEMCRYLISIGHHKIAFIKGHLDHGATEQRLSGYTKALKEAGIPILDQFIQQGNFSFESGEDCARRLLSLKVPPSAIFASNDYMAAGIVKVAKQKGISIPHDLTVTGFDNAPASRYIWPSLTTIKQPITEMAIEATRMLIRIIRKKPLEKLSTTIRNELIVRESSAPAKT